MAYLKIVILQIESIVPRYKFGVSQNPSGSLQDEPAQWILLGLKLAAARAVADVLQKN